MNTFAKFKEAAISKDEMRRLKGSGACGVQRIDGAWIPVPDLNGDGATKDEALLWRYDSLGTGRWCCDSCPWNQVLAD
jgi:hypothetical protein